MQNHLTIEVECICQITELSSKIPLTWMCPFFQFSKIYSMAYFIVFPVSSSIDKKIYIFRKNMVKSG